MSNYSSNTAEFVIKLSSIDFCGEYLVKSITLCGKKGDFTILPNHSDYVTTLKNSLFNFSTNKEFLISSDDEKKNNTIEASLKLKTLKFYIFEGLIVFKNNILLIIGNKLFQVDDSIIVKLENKIKNVQTQLDICANEEKIFYLNQSLNQYQLILNELMNDKF